MIKIIFDKVPNDVCYCMAPKLHEKVGRFRILVHVCH